MVFRAHYFYGFYVQGCCHFSDHRKRGCWWYLCSLVVHRRFRRIFPCNDIKPVSIYSCFGKQFCTCGNGRNDVGCDVCPADRHLSDCRDNRWIPVADTSDNYLNHIVSHNKIFHTTLNIFKTAGRTRGVADSR